jgi:ribose transport system substrate-binding protein
MKRFFLVFLAMTLIAAMSFGALAEDKPTIAYVTREMGDDAGQIMVESSIRAALEAAGVEYALMTVNTIKDVSEQANLIEEAATMGVDGIIVNPNDGSTSLEAIKFATDKGIPVVIVDGRLDSGFESYYVTQVGAANDTAGKQAAEILTTLRPEGGKYIAVRGVNGSVVLDTRTDAFIAALEESNWECVGDMNNETSDNAGAMKVVENMLAAAGYDVDIVFVSADSWFPGIAQCLEDANLTDQIKLVGVDASKVGLGYMQSGLCIGEAQVDLGAVGRTAAEIVVSIVNGEKTAAEFEPITGVDTVIVYEADIETSLEKAF